MKRLLNKVAVITGAGSGIGAATAKLFAKEGAKTILIDSNEESLKNTVQYIKENFEDVGVIGQLADVANQEQAHAAIQNGVNVFGKINTLVNNASMRNYSSIVNASAQEWHDVVSVNLIGTANYCKVVLPYLRENSGSSIVNISSCYALTGRKGMGLYDATKAAQLAMTRTLAFEEAVHGVRVNAICPGSTLTEFHISRAKENGKSLEQLKTERATTSLLGRWADPLEIAAPVLWFASDEASFITGTQLIVDGGLSIM